MKEFIAEFLICPSCLPAEVRLSLKAEERVEDDVVTGRLECSRCGARFPVSNGIADLAPSSPGADRSFAESKYEKAETTSSYLWSHFGDLLHDPEATPAYGEWASKIRPGSGFFLDAGCAVGRFTFEMGLKSDLAIGLDYSRSFIRTARKLMKERRLVFPLIEEGRLAAETTIELPHAWSSSRTEFIVGDAQALPFPPSLFAGAASLNLVDKLPGPMKHLQEMNRVLGTKGAQFLFSDPFSWSQDAAEEREWLGGTPQGVYKGRGPDVVASILEGKLGDLSPPWTLEERGSLWWKIRNHCNHFELIRSCVIKAAR